MGPIGAVLPVPALENTLIVLALPISASLQSAPSHSCCSPGPSIHRLLHQPTFIGLRGCKIVTHLRAIPHSGNAIQPVQTGVHHMDGRRSDIVDRHAERDATSRGTP